jgi:solute:Na+ symporter, SSS family
LSLLDNTIIVFYFILIAFIGFYYSKKKDQNSTDYFLSGRNLGWFAIGISLFATNISSEQFIGLSGTGASTGLAVAPFELMFVLILFLLGYFLAPLFVRSGAFTFPEFIGKRFDKNIRMYLTSISVLIYIVLKISIILFTGGMLLHETLDWDLNTSAIFMVMLTGLYTVIGGMEAVIRTQIYQTGFFVVGVTLLAIFGFQEIRGFDGLLGKLSTEYFAVVKSSSDPNFPWTGVLFGVPIIGFWYWCTDQYIIQRLFSAKNTTNARKGIYFTVFLEIILIFFIVLSGLIAVALFPDAKGDQAYPFLLTSRILPFGIKGIVVAGLIAAIMSSLSSIFNSASALYTMDIYRTFNPNASERKLVLVGRITTTIIVLCAILWVPIMKFINLEIYIFMQHIPAYIGPPIAAVLILGLTYKKINSKGAIWGLGIGGVIGLIRLFLEIVLIDDGTANDGVTWFLGINYLHFAIFLFVLSSAAMVLISNLHPLSVLKSIKYGKA